MFCVVYQWTVKPGKEDEFRSTWRGITEAIFRQHGSLGSRLHRSLEGDWLAYAQWPDRAHWENQAETIGVDLLRSQQSDCLSEEMKILFKLDMTDDLLQSHAARIRVARPTDRLEDVLRFYRDGLGLKESGRFQNHDGFDGVMLGSERAPYHFEFTSCRGHKAGEAPTKDNLLVFYLPDTNQWNAAVDRMRSHGYAPVPSFNPYWDRQGLTFEDPDGYRIVLQNE